MAYIEDLTTTTNQQPTDIIDYFFTQLDISDVTPPRYVVKNMFYTNTLTQVFGQPETCKSLIFMDMGLHLANGRDWCGHRSKTCQIFYLAGEGQHGLKIRAKAWCDENGGNTENFFVVNKPPALIEQGHAQAILAAIEEHGNPDMPAVIIVDTLQRCFGCGDENSAQDMGLFVRALDLLREYFQACVIVIHHSDKKGLGARGSGAMKGSVDVEYEVKKNDGISTLTCTKTKDLVKPDKLYYMVQSIVLAGIKDEDGEQVTAPLLAQIGPDDIEEPEVEAEPKQNPKQKQEVSAMPHHEIDGIWMVEEFKIQRKRFEQEHPQVDHDGIPLPQFRQAFCAYLGEKVSAQMKRRRFNKATEYAGLKVNGSTISLDFKRK